MMKLRMFNSSGSLLKPFSADDEEVINRWSADFGDDGAMCQIWNDIVDLLDDGLENPSKDAVIQMLFRLEEAAYIAGYKRGSADRVDVEKIVIKTKVKASTVKAAAPNLAAARKGKG